MFKITFKNRLLAIGATIIASLLATTGLFFAINNLTKSLSSFDQISTDDTVLRVELFSPLLASIKNNKPVADFETINSTLQQSLNYLANNNYQINSLKDLLGEQGHALLSFTNAGDAYLIAAKDNDYSPEILKQPLFQKQLILDDLTIYSNNDNLLTKISKSSNKKSSLLISFNDLAKITVDSNLFKATNLTPALNTLKETLSPLSAENASFTASIQQSNHRTKIQFFNTNSNNPKLSKLESLFELIPKQISTGFIFGNSTSTLNFLSQSKSKTLMAENLDEQQPLMYAANGKDWLISTTNKTDNTANENLVSLFANAFTTKVVSSLLPDMSSANEIFIKDLKTLDWENSISPSLSWQTKHNQQNNLTIAQSKDYFVGGSTNYVNLLISKGGYFPADCKVKDAEAAVIHSINNKTLYYSENSNKNAIFCIFN